MPLDLQNLLGRLPILVGGLVAPGVIEGNGRLGKHVGVHVLLGDLVIGHNGVITVAVTDTGIDENVGVDRLDVLVHHAALLLALAVGGIAPECGDIAVLRKDLMKLRLQLLLPRDPIVLFHGRGEIPEVCPGLAVAVLILAPAAAVRLVPVNVLRVVEAEAHAVLLTGGRHLGDDIAPEGSGIHHVIGIDLGVIECEALVVLRGDNDILDARILGKLYPLLRIKEDRVKGIDELLVLGLRDLQAVHDPFAEVIGLDAVAPFAAKHRVKPPVNEHTEFCALEPFSVCHSRSPYIL